MLEKVVFHTGYRERGREFNAFHSRRNSGIVKEQTELVLQRRIRLIVKRVKQVMFALLFVGLIMFGQWFFSGKMYRVIWESQYNGFMQGTAKLGFAINDIYITGKKNASTEDMSRILDIYKGDPILDLDLQEIKKRVEQMEWVKYAAVERKFPGTLVLSITEREPVAIWQHAGQLYLLDEDGTVIDKPGDVGYFADLIIIVGEEVPYYAQSLLAFLSEDKELYQQISSIIRIGNRRWDVRLHNGVEIKLPEKSPEQAVAYLTKMQHEKKILYSDVEVIDLRLSDKLFIQ